MPMADMGDGMDDSLYGDDMPEKEKPSQKSVDDEEKEDMDPQEVVSLKVLTGKHGPPKEGDEIVVKVVSIHGDQAVIKYAPEKPEGDEDEGMDHSEMDDEKDMAELNSKY